MKRFPDILLLIIAIGTILSCSFSATGWLRSSLKKEKPKVISVYPKTTLLKSGDLIFRDGRSFISHALKQFNRRDSRFSHAGLIHMENGKPFVYHCMGGEGSSNNKMRKEPLSSFCSNKEVNVYSIFRPSVNDMQLEAIDSVAGTYYGQGLEFDTKFDLSNSDKMYCTELIYNIFKKVLKEDNFISLTEMAGVSYISCDNIFLHDQMKELYTHSYKRSNQTTDNETYSN